VDNERDYTHSIAPSAMSSQVTLQVFAGALSGQTYTFTEPTVCIVGREDRCQIQLPDDEAHKTISRFHCLLDISPPSIRVRDFGSLNGTYVNDTKIGQRPAGVSLEEARKQQYPEHDLQDSDRVRIGETVFQVQIINKEPQRQPQTIPPGAEGQGLDFLVLLQNLLARAKQGGGGDDVNLPALSNYKIIQSIAQGSFGAVYLAEQEQTRQQVAIKLMLPHAAASTLKINMFLREIACLRALNHPNVVKFIEVGYSEDVFFLVMEYCNGGTLEDLVQQLRRPLTVYEALPIIDQILDGLAYSHRVPLPMQKPDGEMDTMYGIVHRDLKPSNFFIHNTDSRQIVKVGDYGLAKCFDMAGLSGQTVTGSNAGTPVFMCRQQLLNYKYSKPEVDIWAVAATLYYLLTGCFPRDFDGSDPLKAILTNPVIPIRQRGVNIPSRLADAIDKALDEGNGSQPLAFGSAIEFQRALKQAL
jgi:eukaryotic-like serine/threonine-protein kinase